MADEDILFGCFLSHIIHTESEGQEEGFLRVVRFAVYSITRERLFPSELVAVNP